ncbi:ABC transporter [Nocardiopsis nanhaiensis]
MNGTLYRLETTRLIRTHTLLALVLLCGVFGALGPLTAYFTKDLVEMAEPGMGIDIPAATAPDALGSYMELAAPFGVLAVVLVAAAALSVDASPGRSAFYRSRVKRASDLVLPRFALSTAAALAAFLAGALVAWAVTSFLYQSLPLVSTLLGAFLAGLYLAFAVAVVALVSTVARSTLATAGFSVLVLVVVLIVGQLPFLAQWGPSGLLNGQVGLSSGVPLAEFAPMAAVTVVFTAAVLAVAVRRSGAREI